MHDARICTRLNVWRKVFRAAGFASAGLDARLIMQHITGYDGAQLIARDQDVLSPEQNRVYDALCVRRQKGEPVARIVGHCGFYGRDFCVNEHVLLPRPETEMLVDFALQHLPQEGVFADLGTGSGAIAIAILAQRPDVRAVASDLSAKALVIAKQNALIHQVVDRLDLVRGDWFAPFKTHVKAQKFDLIVSNPPYIGRSERAQMNKEALLYDPEMALFAADDGLAAYETIIPQAPAYLKPGGFLAVEIGYRQGQSVRDVFKKTQLGNVQVEKDLQGHDRMVRGCFNILKNKD